MKVLRLHPDTGELAALVEDGVEPYSVNEFHNCVEEVFLISGDLTLGNSGEMLARTAAENQARWERARQPYSSAPEARSACLTGPGSAAPGAAAPGDLGASLIRS